MPGFPVRSPRPAMPSAWAGAHPADEVKGGVREKENHFRREQAGQCLFIVTWFPFLGTGGVHESAEVFITCSLAREATLKRLKC